MINTIIITISILGIVLLNPIGDAFRDKGNKSLQKNLELIRDTLFFGLIYWIFKNFWFMFELALSYLFLRTAIHNLAYNLTRGLPWYYVGTTSISDNIEHIMLDKWDRNSFIIGRSVCLIMAIIFLILSLKSLN